MAKIIEEMREVVFQVVGNKDQASEVVYALIRHFGGERIYMPSCDYQARNKEIRALYSTGGSIQQLAKRYSLHKRTVTRIIRNSDAK